MSYLNGVYYTDQKKVPGTFQGIVWYNWVGLDSLKSSTMIISHNVGKFSNRNHLHTTNANLVAFLKCYNVTTPLNLQL